MSSDATSLTQQTQDVFSFLLSKGGDPLKTAANQSNGIDDLLTRLDLLERENRVNASREIVVIFNNGLHTANEVASRFQDWLVEKNIMTEREIEKDFDAFANAAKRGKKQEKDRQGYIKRVDKNWGDNRSLQPALAYTLQINTNRARDLADYARDVPQYNYARRTANEALIFRLTSNPKAGQRSFKQYTKADFDRARSPMAVDQTDEETRAYLGDPAVMMEFDNSGWLYDPHDEAQEMYAKAALRSRLLRELRLDLRSV